MNIKNTLFIFVLVLLSYINSYGQEKVFELDSLKYGPGKVFYKVDKPASFPGGYERMREFFKLKFDPHDSDGSITEGPKEGMVEAVFIVEPNGKVKYVEITKHYTNYMDEEMTNTLISMPKWEPALLDGKPVRCFSRYRYAINFY